MQKDTKMYNGTLLTISPKARLRTFKNSPLYMRNTFQGFLASNLPVTKFTDADS